MRARVAYVFCISFSAESVATAHMSSLPQRNLEAPYPMTNVRRSCGDGPASLCAMQRSCDIRCEVAAHCLEAATFSVSRGSRSMPRSFVVRDALMVMTGILHPATTRGHFPSRS
ncbi:ribonuclease HI [Trypanosoma cruzi]|nr:ribonuclease HI [Trypanosoma cruzi]